MKDSDGLELQVNANEMCRTCLAAELPPDQLKPIFCNEIVDGRIIPFPKVLELTMGFKPTKNEILPVNVCINCKTKLKELYSFKDKVCKSEELLYEIFNCEKPPEQKPTVVAATRPPTSTTETQTDCMRFDENDVGSYRDFLKFQRAPKPATRDVSIECFVPAVEAACQTVPNPKPASRSTSVQVTPPQKLLKHSETQVNIDDELELEVLQFDVVEMMDESEPEQQQQPQLPSEQLDQVLEEATAQSEVQDFETDENLPEEPLQPVGKLEAVAESEDPSEYLSYEALEEPDSDSTTKGKQTVTEQPAATKPASECQYCQFATDDKAAFKEHLNVHHQTLENIFIKAEFFRCINCFSVFDSALALKGHFHDGPCVAIGNELVETEEVERHEKFYSHGFDICLPRMKSFHKIDKITVACGTCNMQFKTLEEALNHYSIHEHELESQQDVDQIWENNDFSQVHYCGICNEPFPDATFIRQHVYFHRNAYDCPFECPASCFTFGSLTEHIKRHLVSSSEEPQPPPSTPKPSLKKPKSSSQQPADLVCEICSKGFNSKASLKVHTKNHFADKRHSCIFCTKSFIQKSDLTIHIRSHTDERPFPCTVPGCDKKFRTSSHRRDHMSTHAQQNTFQCEFCQKLFKAERILQGHLRLHTGLKPFECKLCGKAFSRKQHLKLHMKTHEKEKE